ncbi:MAG: SGNH/GDSL hydrolase family protein [Spirochaetes bacterium]|nr:SGNH/GDSL hydrolase family protein [Spirochaetota bacterium]
MKTIVCFGDSNTWGYNPATCGRYPPTVRWPCILAATLEAGFPGGFEIVAEGQNGRTSVWDDPLGQKNGSKYLLPCLESHMPVDLIIIMLGTNDLKHRFGLSSWDVAMGLGRLVELVKGCAFGPLNAAPKVLVVAPCAFGKMSSFSQNFLDQEGQSLTLGRDIGALAALNDFPFFDAGSVIHSSDLDGIHLDPEEHGKLGRALAEKAVELLGRPEDRNGA